jgi:hypothetical protein
MGCDRLTGYCARIAAESVATVNDAEDQEFRR